VLGVTKVPEKEEKSSFQIVKGVRQSVHCLFSQDFHGDGLKRAVGTREVASDVGKLLRDYKSFLRDPGMYGTWGLVYYTPWAYSVDAHC
jgi:hypothetical protein